MPNMKYKGSCHCGRVAFEVEGEIKGEKLRLRTPEDAASTYMFNKHAIKHRFCPVCGIQPYSEGTDPKGNAMAAVNIRCLAGVDLSAIHVQNYDGRSL